MRRAPGHRSSLATLKRLARENVYIFKGTPRREVMGLIPLPEAGLRVTRLLAERYGADRERGGRELARAAAALLGARDWRRLPPGERLAFERWSPLVAALPGIGRWSPARRRALYAVMRAKGGRRESDFVRLFDRHAPLRRALARLAAEPQ